MKRAILAAAAIAAAALFFIPSNRPNGGGAAAAVPTPAAFAYDEIDRMIIPPATPPAPGTFQADYQAIVTAGKPSGDNGASPAPHHGMFGNLMNSVMNGSNPQEMLERMRLGTLTRYTYYKGWIRTDDPVAQTAVIEKCQEHQYVTLDLAKKTYTIATEKPPCTSTYGPSTGRTMAVQSQPGTADMNFSASSTNLGPLTIEGVATTGSDDTVSMSTTNATGSCQNSELSMKMTQYVSTIAVPRPYCPLPRTMGGPVGMMSSSGGCQPRLHGQSQGATAMTGLAGGKLVMFSVMGMGSINNAMMETRMKGGGMLTERGNVKWSSGADADALFSIPPDFAKSGS